MKGKRFLIAFLTLIITTGALLFVGNLFSIDWLMFSYEYENSADGFSFSASSFMPLILGLVASFIAENIYVRKMEQKKRMQL